MSITVHFFLDLSVIQSLEGKNIDISKGHLILFGNHDKDGTLKVSALLDGSSIDFLFGVYNASQNSINRTKANNVKKFVRQLDSTSQIEIAKFYGSVYKAVVDYYNWREKNWYWCCWDEQRIVMIKTIEAAYEELKNRIGTQLHL